MMVNSTVEDGIIKPKPAWVAPYIVDLSSLKDKDIPPVKWLVDGILPEGVTMLAAPPKSYKSYMCMHLGLCVAQGIPFFDRKTKKANVVYFDLESTERRAKERAAQIGLGFPENFYVVPGSPQVGILGEGFEETLANAIVMYDAELVIIDVFQGIRPPMKRTQTGYDRDYKDISRIKETADASHTSIILVNHTVKMKQTNVFNQVSGSIGTYGALDTMWLIDREDPYAEDAVFYVSGRDLEPQKYSITWDADNFIWICRGDADRIERENKEVNYLCNPIRMTIVKLVKQGRGRWEGRVSEIIKASTEIDKGFTEIFDDERRVGRYISQNRKDFMKIDGIRAEIKQLHSYNKWIFNSVNSD